MKTKINFKKIYRDIARSLLPTAFMVAFCFYYEKYEEILRVFLFSMSITVIFMWLSGQILLLLELSGIKKYRLVKCKLLDNVEAIGSRGIPVFTPFVEVYFDDRKMSILLEKYKTRFTLAKDANLDFLLNEVNPKNSIIVSMNPYLTITK